MFKFLFILNLGLKIEELKTEIVEADLEADSLELVREFVSELLRLVIRFSCSYSSFCLAWSYWRIYFRLKSCSNCSCWWFKKLMISESLVTSLGFLYLESLIMKFAPIEHKY